MPRPRRFCPPGLPIHIIQRGNNKQACFTCEQDYVAYLHWLQEGACRFDVAIHAWVLMTNHVHLLVPPTDHSGVSSLMQHVGRSYVRRFNDRYSRTGTLFEGRFRSCVVQDAEYLLNCLCYIELNPVRSDLTEQPGDYAWSSYRSHAYGVQMHMQTPHDLYLALASGPAERQLEYRKLIEQKISADVIGKIRHCTNRGLALGSQTFRDEIERLRS